MIRPGILLVVAVGLSLAACGKRGDPKPPKKDPVKTEETVSEE